MLKPWVIFDDEEQCWTPMHIQERHIASLYTATSFAGLKIDVAITFATSGRHDQSIWKMSHLFASFGRLSFTWDQHGNRFSDFCDYARPDKGQFIRETQCGKLTSFFSVLVFHFQVYILFKTRHEKILTLNFELLIAFWILIFELWICVLDFDFWITNFGFWIFNLESSTFNF